MSLAKLLFPHKKNIVRIHTDGFISLKNLDNELKAPSGYNLINKQLGGLKKEFIGEDVNIIKLNELVWYKNKTNKKFKDRKGPYGDYCEKCGVDEKYQSLSMVDFSRDESR